MIDLDPVFNRRDAAAFLESYLGRPVTHRMLARLASEGRGPAYQLRLALAVYTPKDLLAWVQEISREPKSRRRVVPFTPRRLPDPDYPGAA